MIFFCFYRENKIDHFTYSPEDTDYIYQLLFSFMYFHTVDKIGIRSKMDDFSYQPVNEDDEKLFQHVYYI
jgi:hypothetical protein